jgi:hypothetical protein
MVLIPKSIIAHHQIILRAITGELKGIVTLTQVNQDQKMTTLMTLGEV